MKVAVEVKDRKEADAVRLAMEDPAMRAFVVVVGTLMSLPTDKARQRVMSYVEDHLRDAAERRPELDT